jgi:hypothetical protein
MRISKRATAELVRTYLERTVTVGIASCLHFPNNNPKEETFSPSLSQPTRSNSTRWLSAPSLIGGRPPYDDIPTVLSYSIDVEYQLKPSAFQLFMKFE